MKWLFVLLVIWAAWQLLGKCRAKKPLVRPAIADEVEARQVLGITRDADADAVRAAHRRLVAQVHPDRGGSAELTRRVNAARDLLLGRLG